MRQKTLNLLLAASQASHPMLGAHTTFLAKQMGPAARTFPPDLTERSANGVHGDTGQQGAAGAAATDILFSSHASSFLRNRINDTDCN